MILVEAMGFMRNLVENSGTYQSSRKINVESFRLNTKNETAPSLFEVIFIEDNEIVGLFNSTATNPNNAQLIFNTHNTNLLNNEAQLFRRDQIWFTKKDHYGAATLYSLADFKTNTVRKEDNYEKNYTAGKYGAVPFLEDFKSVLNS